jgi:hypothetical protein
VKFIGFLIVGLSLLAMGVLSALIRRQRRVKASAVPAAHVIKEARKVPARVFVDKDMVGGPQQGRTNRSQADLVLTDGRLLVATHQGRVLELTSRNPGSVRCTGPRRLILEGERLQKEGVMKVRVELICDDAQSWADVAALELGAKKSVAQLGS